MFNNNFASPAHFPSYEVLHDEEKNISSQDFIYVFSLILYYSCILRVSEFFQKCCEGLDSKHQTIVLKFLASIKHASDKRQTITKEMIRSAIKDAIPPSPVFRFISSSPLKTPDKVPPTPQKTFYYEKTKELQRVKTQLENERYERNMLDVEVKQYEQKIEQLGELNLYLKQNF